MIEDLARLARRTEWVAEEPRVHLLPHLEAAAAIEGCELDDVREDAGVLELRVVAPVTGAGNIRRLALRLLASVAETSTFVHERREGAEAVFDVVTGLAPGSTVFETHGHALRLRVRPAPGSDGGADRGAEQA